MHLRHELTIPGPPMRGPNGNLSDAPVSVKVLR